MTAEKKPELENADKLKVVVLGSFRFKEQIDEVIMQLKSLDVEVLAPLIGEVGGQIYHYPILVGEEARDPVDIQTEFLLKINQADAIYIVDPGGYTGLDVNFEIASAEIDGLPIVAMEPMEQDPTDRFYQHFVDRVINLDIESFVKSIRKIKDDETLAVGYLSYVPISKRKSMTYEEARSAAKLNMAIRAQAHENELRERQT